MRNKARVTHRIALTGLAVSFLSVGCSVARTASVPPGRPAPLLQALPPLSVEVPSAPSKGSATDRAKGEASRITLSASNVDVRELLPAIASSAGVSIVMAPDVRGRVTVHFVNADARDVLRAVIEQAGLTVGPSELIAPFPRPVFYDLPVNVNEATAAVIRLRFGISAALAELVVDARPR